MRELLVAVRRRLRWTWALATAQRAAPAVALVALALVVAGRFRPWAWPERAAVGFAVVALLAVAVSAVAIRIPTLVAARAADRGLRTRDAFAAAVELGDAPGELPDRVRARAATLASGAKPSEAIPVPAQRRRLLVAAVLVAGACGLAWLPNH
ncbi:MAG: hypothetical protein ACRDZN_12325, partial [Acidimicrobiales bacterium]